MGADGRVKQIKLTTTTGNPRVDECVDKALASITSLGEPPPLGMPEAGEFAGRFLRVAAHRAAFREIDEHVEWEEHFGPRRRRWRLS